MMLDWNSKAWALSLKTFRKHPWQPRSMRKTDGRVINVGVFKCMSNEAGTHHRVIDNGFFQTTEDDGFKVAPQPPVFEEAKYSMAQGDPPVK